MTNKFAKIHLGALLACAGACALPGTAYAGTSTATGSAAMSVSNQCSVTGANINLGTYSTNQTVGDIASDLGYWGGGWGEVFYPGATAEGGTTLGSVTCDTGTPYTIKIDVPDYQSGEKFISFKLGSETLTASVWGNRIGDQLLGTNFIGIGNNWWLSDTAASGVGTGAPQEIKGNIFIEAVYSSLQWGDKLGPAGTYSEPMFYTLNF